MPNKQPQKIGRSIIDKVRIRFPILAPLFVAILVLLVTFTIAVYHFQQQHITSNVRMRLDSTKRSFSQLFAADARLLGASTYFLKNDPNIQNAWLARDRDKLLELTTPLFENLRRDYKVTHFYFIDTDRNCFLRVHNPPRFGDRIDRFTLDSAAKTGKSAWGIELGPYGTFTLREVHPWFINNTLAGYIELGEEIEHISPQLKETLNIDLVFMIDKSFLKREMWEEGLKMMGRNGNWDQISDYVIADSTIPVLPPEFIKFARMPHDRHRERIFSAQPNGSTYRAGFIPLYDAGGREVGDILVIKNVTADQASLHALLVVVAGLCFFIGVLLFLFFYTRIAGIEKRLLEAHVCLENEIEKRKQTEDELREHRDHLEETVRSRTAELEETNKHLYEENAERKKAEEISRQERDFSQASIDSLPGLFYLFDDQGRFLRTNKNFENISGYSADEISRMTPLDFFGETDKKNITDAIQRVFQTGEATAEADFLSKDQTRTPYFFTGKLFLFNQKSCLIGMGIDITERKQAEELLACMAAMLDATPDFVGFADAKDGKIAYINTSGRKMVGLGAQEDVTRLKIADVHPAWTNKLLRNESIPTAIRDGIWTGECAFLNRDGREIPVLMELLAHKSPNGEVERFSTVSRDITERKQAEQRQTQLLEQLEKANKYLQQENYQRISAEKSLEKLNVNLESTVAQLNQSNRELREFTHLAAHDLKTPLRGIGTLAQWLLDDYYDKFDERGQKQIGLLVKRVGRMDNLINAVLQYSTIVRNRKNEQPADLNTLFRAALTEIKPPQNIKITTNKDLPIVICAEGHIYQVFYQLMANAVRFMNKTDGRITIDCAEEDKFWRFSVSDNGPGIEPQHFERIFRLFQTLENRDEIENTGVGLALVKKIVELYGGRIWLISQPGQGTTFNFTLPKRETTSENEKNITAAAAR